MDDPSLDLCLNTASSTKQTLTEKQHMAENDMVVYPEKINVSLVADFSSPEENTHKLSEQESKKYLHSHEINKIDKPLESQDVITGSNWKTKRKLSEEPSTSSEAKRRKDIDSASSRKTEDKPSLPDTSDQSEIASSDCISSQLSRSADSNSKFDSSVNLEVSTGRNYVSHFICKQCSKVFSCNSSLKTHMGTHSRDETFECVLCEKTFHSKYYLDEHFLRVHTIPERSYRCKKCEKSFAFKHDLTIHSKRHKGEMPFPCNECEKSFIRKYELTQHSRFHTGERPFPCNLCEKSFASKGDLKRHNRSHTGEKPYVCKTCGKAYARNDSLNSHKNTHNGKSKDT